MSHSLFTAEEIIHSNQTFVLKKKGFWVWVLGWVLYLNPNPKPKNLKTQNLNPIPKNFIPKPKTQAFLYPNPKGTFHFSANLSKKTL